MQKALAELGRKIVFMEKNTPAVLKEIPAWIDNVPTAKAYKNAVIAGNGDRLFRVIKMVGNQEAYKTCVADFVHFLFQMNLVKDKKISSTASEYIHSNVEQVTHQPGNYWFFDDVHNPTPGTKIVVFNISDIKVENETIKQLIEKIGLTVDYSTMSLLLEEYPGWENIEEDDFINNTLLSHYGSYQDDILKTSDLEWINDVLIGNDANSIVKTAEGEEVKEGVPQELELTDEVQLARPMTEEKVNESEIEVKGMDEVPAPELSEDEPEEETVESAQAKIAYNKQLNAKMYEIYEQTATRLKAERDPRWKEFISEYKKAIEDENYTVKTCPRYLNMTSRDAKAPIYKVLYDADQATKQYEKDLMKIRRKTMCFACHRSFEADITFAKQKEHTVKCPNCGNLVRIMIDWLK
jgi:DNA-directed RNA polymerase subunit RPC12/RpoP